jgi:hypothetical protein
MKTTSNSKIGLLTIGVGGRLALLLPLLVLLWLAVWSVLL